MHVLLHSVLPTLHQATTDPRLCWRLLDTHRQVWVSLLWGHCSFLLGPGAQSSVCALQESIFQSCVSSGISVVGLKVTSSKRAYAIPKSAAPKAPVRVAVHCWRIPPQEMLTVLSQSLLGPWVLVCTRFAWALWASLAGMGFDSKHEFPLLPSCWGFFALGHGVSPYSCSSAYCLTGVSQETYLGFTRVKNWLFTLFLFYLRGHVGVWL